jgi:hypothetical protein
MITLIPSSVVIILKKIILLRIQNILIRRRALPHLIHRHTNSLPVSEKPIVRTLQDNTLHFVGVAEVPDVGFAAEVLDLLIDDCGRNVWVPALRRGESFKVAGM